MRSIVVCADDAGWSDANDEAIRCLAVGGRVSAVSVLVEGPSAADWKAAAPPATCALGLHFNLTWSAARGSRGLARLVAAACCGRLPGAWIEERIRAQLRRFETLYSRPPDFVDGHQHVHMLPGVRQPLLRLLETRYRAAGRPAIRVPLGARQRGLKAAVLNRLGAGALEAALRAGAWPRNRDFAGAYGMGKGDAYRQRMQAWLADIASGGLIMAHPGDDSLAEHGAARAAEHAYLAGDEWLRDLERAKVRLIPFTADALSSVASAA